MWTSFALCPNVSAASLTTWKTFESLVVPFAEFLATTCARERWWWCRRPHVCMMSFYHVCTSFDGPWLVFATYDWTQRDQSTSPWVSFVLEQNRPGDLPLYRTYMWASYSFVLEQNRSEENMLKTEPLCGICGYNSQHVKSLLFFLLPVGISYFSCGAVYAASRTSHIHLQPNLTPTPIDATSSSPCFYSSLRILPHSSSVRVHLLPFYFLFTFHFFTPCSRLHTSHRLFCIAPLLLHARPN
jgi:hypothetical protein